MTITSPTLDDTDADNPMPRSLPGFCHAVESGRYPVVPAELAAAVDARGRLLHGTGDLWGALPGDDFLAQVVAGASLREALTAALDRQDTLERRRLADNLVASAQQRLDHRIPEIVTRTLPALLAGLRTELEATVTMLRESYAAAASLDLDSPDAVELVNAGEGARQGLVTIDEQTKRYRALRMLQRDALAASTLRPPQHSRFGSSTWREFFAVGVHELKGLTSPGLPGADLPRRAAVRAVVSRRDVWLPDPEEMAEAYQRLLSVIAQAERDADEGRKNAEAQRRRDRQGHALDPGTVAVLNANTNNNLGGRW